jgi:hypothetical protein
MNTNEPDDDWEEDLDEDEELSDDWDEDDDSLDWRSQLSAAVAEKIIALLGELTETFQAKDEIDGDAPLTEYLGVLIVGLAEGMSPAVVATAEVCRHSQLRGYVLRPDEIIQRSYELSERLTNTMTATITAWIAENAPPPAGPPV